MNNKENVKIDELNDTVEEVEAEDIYVEPVTESKKDKMKRVAKKTGKILGIAALAVASFALGSKVSHKKSDDSETEEFEPIAIDETDYSEETTEE